MTAHFVRGAYWEFLRILDSDTLDKAATTKRHPCASLIGLEWKETASPLLAEWLLLNLVGVEKLFSAKFAKITLRQDAT